MRHLIPLVLILTGPTFATAAEAAAPTCHGQRATIVGELNKSITGTPHRDVIVTNRALDVTAGAGDDLVCVTGRPTFTQSTTVFDGPGDDVVDARGLAGDEGVVIFLTEGDDEAVGSGGPDTVWTEKGGRDQVATGGGNDSVIVSETSGPATVSLGAGADRILAGRPRGLHVDGGGGPDVLQLDEYGVREGTSYSFDNRTGRARIAGRTELTWTSLRSFKLQLPAASPVKFMGTDLIERVDLAASPGDGTDGRVFALKLKGGNDRVSLRGADGGSVDLGGGHDQLKVVSEAGAVDVDLAAGVIDTVGRDDFLSSHSWIEGVDDVTVYGIPLVTLTGNNQGNVLAVLSACTSAVHGRGGADVISATAQACPAGSTSQHQLFGDDGGDRLTGTKRDDLLDGGPGVDIAEGMAGTDVCYAEVTTSCEGP